MSDNILLSLFVQERHFKPYTIPVKYDSETHLWNVSCQALAADVAVSSGLLQRSEWDNEYSPTF
jgi:hypothetical protein